MEFGDRRPEATRPLLAWYVVTVAAVWKNGVFRILEMLAGGHNSQVYFANNAGEIRQFATLQVNAMDLNGPPGAPNWVSVAQIDGAHSGDALNVLVDSHSAVHLAQIHAGLLV